MLKLIGGGIILIGILGAVNSWNDSKKRRIKNIEAMINLLINAEYVLVREKRKSIYFFNVMGEEDSDISRICKEMGAKLRKHEHPTGIETWRECVAQNRDNLCMDKVQIELMNQTGEAFFTRTSEQMSNLLEIYREQFEEILKKEKKKIEEQRKIVMPLSAFGGILLIIILV